MKTSWYKGVDRKDAQAVEERRVAILTSSKGFKILSDILKDRINTKSEERNKPELITQPDYAVTQAYASGYLHALKLVRELIDILEE